MTVRFSAVASRQLVTLRPSGVVGNGKLAIGAGALAAYIAATSYGSIGIGTRAAGRTTSGDTIVAVGHMALETNVIGSNIAAVGIGALRFSTGGSGTAFGAWAATNTTTSPDISAFGVLAAAGNTTGIGINVFGSNALEIATACNNIVAMGSRAMKEKASGDNCIAVGVEALYGGIHGDQIIDGAFSIPGIPNWFLGGGTWSDGGGYAAKTIDGVGLLSPHLAGAPYIDYGVGAHYLITYTVRNYVSGTVTCQFGGVADVPRSANGTYTFPVVPILYPQVLAGGGALLFSPSNTARLGIDDVSLIGTDASTGQDHIAIGSGAGYMLTTGSADVNIGTGAGRQATTANDCVNVGVEAGLQNGTGDSGTNVGRRAGYSNLAGIRNTNTGAYSGFLGAVGDRNSNFGYQAGYTGGGSNCINLGSQAGRQETGSYKLLIDSVLRGTEADQRAQAIIYGVMDAAPANQRLTFNALVALSQLQVFANNAAALAGGLVATQTYRTATGQLMVVF